MQSTLRLVRYYLLRGAGLVALTRFAGQTATITSQGTMTGPTGPPGGTSFYVQNNWAPCNVGINQKLNGTFMPVWVDPTQMVVGSETLSPVTAVMLFFSKELRTSTMFTRTESASIEVAFDGTTASAAYVDDKGSQWGNGIWILGNGNRGSGSRGSDAGLYASIPCSYSQHAGFVAMTHAYSVETLATIWNNSQASNAVRSLTAAAPAAITAKPEEETA